MNTRLRGTTFNVAVLVGSLLGSLGVAAYGEEVVKAQVIEAPSVPPPVRRTKPATVQVQIETKEHRDAIADGVAYDFWTFGNTVPGPFIRVRQGDTVELALKNDSASKFPHSIDLHAVTGPGGGAAVTQTPPDMRTKFRWKALNPGLYVYHCATPHVPTHVANGMYGLILVEPEQGLPKVDKEFYIMQSEFYTSGAYGEKGFQPLDLDAARREDPAYVVFNGRVGALTGERSLKANVGETVRLFVGNGGPNLASSFHVIGEIFDAVYPEGAVGSAVQRNVQTTLIPAGGAAIVEFKVDAPGTYILVDHSLFRAFDKGAIGMLEARGPEAPLIFKPLAEPQDGTEH